MAWNSITTPVRAQWTRTGVIGGRQGAVLTRGYIRGGPELLAALQRLEMSIKDELLVKATQAGADVLKEAWKQRVPVLDANYRNAIEAKAKPGKVGATGVVQVGQAPVPDDEQPRAYAARLEFGSYNTTAAMALSGTRGSGRGRVAQPSLRPAFDSCSGQMLDAMGDEVKRLIEGAV
jgi:HK97 gp10 family phage protein